MKRMLLLSGVAVVSLFANTNNDSVKTEIQVLKKQIAMQQKMIKQLEKKFTKNKKEVLKKIEKNKKTISKGKSHIVFSPSLRTTFDFVDYKTKQGKRYTNNIFTNRVNLVGKYHVDNVGFLIDLEANSIWGGNSVERTSPNNNFSWVASETPDDTNIRIRRAFIKWKINKGTMFAIGRLNSLNGFPANLSNGYPAGSPIALMGNVEFDGACLKVNSHVLSNLIPQTKEWHSWMKVCAGRAFSDATGKWDTSGLPSYAKNGLANSDTLITYIYPYVGKDIVVGGGASTTWNIVGYDNQASFLANKLDNLGSFSMATIMVKAKHLSHTNSYWNKSLAYVIVGGSWSDPKSGKKMFGSEDGKFGKAIWLGLDMPGIQAGDRWGLSLMKGSKYWKNAGYAEDRVTGSLSEARGTGYEIYYNKKYNKALSFNFRTTLINYEHSGSDGFFGYTGDPDQNDYVDRSLNIRVGIKYSF